MCALELLIEGRRTMGQGLVIAGEETTVARKLGICRDDDGNPGGYFQVELSMLLPGATCAFGPQKMAEASPMAGPFRGVAALGPRHRQHLHQPVALLLT